MRHFSLSARSARRHRPRAAFVLGLVAFFGCRASAYADAPAPGGKVIPLFTIAKSENKNQVQYSIRVDDHCAPAGAAPLSAYWRMLEHGPAATEPILPVEVQAYGLANQTIVSSNGNGGEVHAVLHALPSRPVTVVTSRAPDGSCRAVARVSIGGAAATLFNVYVRLKWDGVDYLLLQGFAPEDAHVVREKIVK
jgi:hypothetical protein